MVTRLPSPEDCLVGLRLLGQSQERQSNAKDQDAEDNAAALMPIQGVTPDLLTCPGQKLSACL